jgi:hypothetical protein
MTDAVRAHYSQMDVNGATTPNPLAPNQALPKWPKAPAPKRPVQYLPYRPSPAPAQAAEETQ